MNITDSQELATLALQTRSRLQSAAKIRSPVSVYPDQLGQRESNQKPRSCKAQWMNDLQIPPLKRLHYACCVMASPVTFWHH